MIKPVENSLALNLVTRISDEVRDETSWNKILCVRKIVKKVIICDFSLVPSQKNITNFRKEKEIITFRLHPPFCLFGYFTNFRKKGKKPIFWLHPPSCLIE
jgi:hypothetical protein